MTDAKIDYLHTDEHLETEPPSLDMAWERGLKHEEAWTIEHEPIVAQMIRRRKREWPLRAAADPYGVTWHPMAWGDGDEPMEDRKSVV